MPTEVNRHLDDGGTLLPGDVLMVARRMNDKAGKPFVWRFFMVVTEYKQLSERVHGMVVGATGKLADMAYTVQLESARNAVELLDPTEWPDGIHAFRMAMILKGQIEDIADL